MKPILYSNTESSFTNNGIGVLTDATKCVVKEERNGAFELEMEYPITGIHYDEIMLQRIILAKPNQTMQTQPFRIYRITRPMNGIVTVYAEHISYDMSGIAISPFNATSVTDAFIKLKQYAVGTCPFTFTTDKTTVANMNVSAPCSMRSQLGGKSGSILDVYGGGEYTFDRYAVRLSQHRGQDNGVVIRYGKNLTDIKQEENCTKVYSAVYPYWVNTETGAVKEITGKLVQISGTFPVERILTYDLSQEFENEPTEAQMIARTQSYITANSLGIPSVNLDVSFVQLEQSEEYKGLALLERVSLCDTVKVHFPKLGVDATAKAVSLTYNVLLDRVDSISLGDAKTRITDTILQAQEASENATTVNQVESIVSQLTAAIIGANGGAVRLLDTNDDGIPDTLYIADDPDPTKAVKVWRFNYQGWGASKNGYNGPFTMGATLDSGIVADFITAGQINASLVKILGDTQFYWDSQNINIVNPQNPQQIIRIGKYDGTHYGIGFSSNGGTTWTSSMDFNGVIATSIGALEISADKITSGTLNAARIGANSIAVEKLTGSISKLDVSGGTAWEINLTNGTMTIGNINADHITAGTINASNVTINNLNASKITSGTLAAARIAASSLTLDKLSASSQYDGITQISNTGIDIKASSVGKSAKTTIKADGLKMYNASGTLIGGIMTLNSTVVTAVNALYNPAYSNFVCDIGEFTGLADASYGLNLSYANTDYLTIGIGYIEGSLVSNEIVGHEVGLQIVGEEGLTLFGGSGASTDAYIGVEDDEIYFDFYYNGTHYRKSIWEIYQGPQD